MDHPGAINVLSLCAGCGAFDLGVRLAVPGARTVYYVEREAHAVAVSGARMEEGFLDAAPVWTDARTFDGRPWRGVVDLLIAGIPCQPHSQAGLRKHEEDERYLWPQVVRIASECAAPVVFIENVGGFKRMLSIVERDLRAHGYRAVAARFSAREVGASHLRIRWFVLAWPADDDKGLRILRRCGLLDGERTTLGDDVDGHSPRVADGDAGRRLQPGRSGRASRPEAPNTGSGCGAVGDDADGRRPRPEPTCGSVQGCRLAGSDPPGLFTRGRDLGLWKDVPADLQPPLSRLAHGAVAVVDDDEVTLRLRLSGATVVPLVAAFALRTLAAHAVKEEGDADR